MGKSAYIIIIISLLAVGIYFAMGSYTLDFTSYDGMSTTELNEIAIDWNYRDLERNLDRNNGNVIFVQGRVGGVQPDMNTIQLCEESVSTMSCNQIFVTISNGICSKSTSSVLDYMGSKMTYDCNNILKDDKVSGYVEIDGVSKAVDGDLIPTAMMINLHCSTC